MGTIAKWRPTWWTEEVHGSAWDRVKGAMQRDWSQTKHDLGIGGHEMNQAADDTINQMAATQHLPSMNETNPPQVIGDWDAAEIPYGYGYGAQKQYGTRHTAWDATIEQQLKSEWMAAQDAARRDWDEVKRFVRRGYEYNEKSNTWPGGSK